jgi:hypothetical protein
MNKKNLFTYVLIGIVISMSLYVSYFKGAYDNDFKNSWQLKIYSKHVIDNNLSLLDANLYGTGWYSDRDLYEYHEIVKINYKYDKELYNCKYWALNWALYFEKHNIEYEFIEPKNHVLVMAKYIDKYCFADGDILNCYNYK